MQEHIIRLLVFKVSFIPCLCSLIIHIIITQFLTYRRRNRLLFGTCQKLLPVWEPVVESELKNVQLLSPAKTCKTPVPSFDGSVSKVSLLLNQHSGSSDPMDLETHLKAFSLFWVWIDDCSHIKVCTLMLRLLERAKKVHKEKVIPGDSFGMKFECILVESFLLSFWNLHNFFLKIW